MTVHLNGKIKIDIVRTLGSHTSMTGLYYILLVPVAPTTHLQLNKLYNSFEYALMDRYHWIQNAIID